MLMPFLFGTMCRCSSPSRPPGLKSCLSSLQGQLFILSVTFSQHAGGGGVGVRCLRGVVAELSGHRQIRSSRFCARTTMWRTASKQGQDADRGHHDCPRAGDVANRTSRHIQ